LVERVDLDMVRVAEEPSAVIAPPVEDAKFWVNVQDSTVRLPSSDARAPPLTAMQPTKEVPVREVFDTREAQYVDSQATEDRAAMAPPLPDAALQPVNELREKSSLGASVLPTAPPSPEYAVTFAMVEFVPTIVLEVAASTAPASGDVMFVMVTFRRTNLPGPSTQHSPPDSISRC
jgi:hypothetical protein